MQYSDSLTSVVSDLDTTLSTRSTGYEGLITLINSEEDSLEDVRKEIREQKEQKRELKTRISTLYDKIGQIPKCKNEEELKNFIQELDHLTPSPAKRTAHSEVMKSQTTCVFKNKSTHRLEDRAHQEMKRFKWTKQQVEKAQNQLSKSKRKKSSVWTKKSKHALNVLKMAKRTKCLYFRQGTCRDGHNCPFLHNRPNAGQHGILYKLKRDSPQGPYAFVRLKSNGEEVFVPERSLRGMMEVREGMKVKVQSLKEPQHKSQKRIAEEVYFYK